MGRRTSPEPDGSPPRAPDLACPNGCGQSYHALYGHMRAAYEMTYAEIACLALLHGPKKA